MTVVKHVLQLLAAVDAEKCAIANKVEDADDGILEMLQVDCRTWERFIVPLASAMDPESPEHGQALSSD